jgi:hypothetical protein
MSGKFCPGGGGGSEMVDGKHTGSHGIMSEDYSLLGYSAI